MNALRGLLPEIAYAPPPIQPLAPGVTRRSPFKGLQSFKEADARDFFGRATAIDELAELFKTRAAQKTGRLLAVIGASGSGKSSLVMAGLIPRLKKQLDTADWLYLSPFAPGDQPIRALTRALSRALPEKSFSAIEDDLRRSHGRGLANLSYTLDQRAVLLIDQFEELFMPGVSADERDQFISLIVQAVNDTDSGLTVLLTLRADFYDRPTNDRELGALVTRNDYTLLPMSLAELREAVEAPTRQADVGLQFEPGLVAEIVFDLRASKERMALAGALPLLQFTLEQLYERRDTHTLTFEAYTAIDGVSGAISQHAESVFAALDEAAQARLGRVFARLIHVDDRGEPTRARADLNAFAADADAMRLIDTFTDARLLITDREGEIPTLEVSHEALLRNWTRLVEWIESAAEKKRLLQKLEVDAEFWAKRGKPAHMQYQYDLEQEIRTIQHEWEIDFAPLIEEFLGSEIDRLIADLDASDSLFQTRTATERLQAIGSDAVPAIIASLTSENINIRIMAAYVLQNIRDSRAVEPLIALLTDSESGVRQSAVEALGELGDPRAVDPLRVLLTDPDTGVRSRALRALGQLIRVLLNP